MTNIGDEILKYTCDPTFKFPTLIDEIEKDAPKARDMLATFVARAVIDDILPPSFLSDAVVCNLGGDIIDYAKRMLSRDHGGAKIEKSWGPGDGRPVE